MPPSRTFRTRCARTAQLSGNRQPIHPAGRPWRCDPRFSGGIDKTWHIVCSITGGFMIDKVSVLLHEAS
jgi:hypothetical protein